MLHIGIFSRAPVKIPYPEQKAGRTINQPSDLQQIFEYDIFGHKLLFCKEKVQIFTILKFSFEQGSFSQGN